MAGFEERNMIIAMTRKEFSAQYDAFRRPRPRDVILVPCLVALAIPLLLFLSDFLEKRYGPAVSNASLIVFLFASLGVLLVLWIRQSISRIKEFGLVCPACHRSLVDQQRRTQALLTGTCLKCGNKVFDAAVAPSYSLDREKFKAKLDDFNRQTKRGLIKAIVMFCLMNIVCIPATKYFQRLVDHGGLDWVISAQWKWFAGLALVAVCVLGAGIFILVFRGNPVLKSNVRPLPCPDCGRSLAGIGRVALEKGICIYCGCRLFEEAPREKSPKST